MATQVPKMPWPKRGERWFDRGCPPPRLFNLDWTREVDELRKQYPKDMKKIEKALVDAVKNNRGGCRKAILKGAEKQLAECFGGCPEVTLKVEYDFLVQRGIFQNGNFQKSGKLVETKLRLYYFANLEAILVVRKQSWFYVSGSNPGCSEVTLKVEYDFVVQRDKFQNGNFQYGNFQKREYISKFVEAKCRLKHVSMSGITATLRLYDFAFGETVETRSRLRQPTKPKPRNRVSGNR